ncbi:MAG TPA: uroporphyrinogen-III C-methyltransferase [Terriglobia bacterium]|nr:uroporphyrinogen-III C-methyltransferase [Terriglobia bacterium]
MIARVYLVGAGPGNPELLTLKALRILQQADLVLHDDLVPPSILNLASPHARIVNVGKRCGRKSISQAEINARLIAAAHQGLTVARLKGGDPSFFGRCGEEIEALREANVDFEIIPGVTAAAAAAATAGFSLTHREVASSVIFLTGHRAVRDTGRKGPQASLAALGASGDLAGKTVVIYMPGPRYASVSAELEAAGVRGDTPCVLISAASTRAQRIHKKTVQELATVPPLAAPSILIVGEVTRLAHGQGHPEFEFVLSALPASGIMRRDRDHEPADQFHSPHRT